MRLPNEPVPMVTGMNTTLPPGFEIRVTDTVHTHDEHYDYTIRTYTLVAIAEGLPEQPLLAAQMRLTPEIEMGHESDAQLRVQVEATFLRDLAIRVNELILKNQDLRRQLITAGHHIEP